MENEDIEYVVLPIEGAATPRFREKPNYDAPANEIAEIYAAAARDGGRVIAGHTLVCDGMVHGPGGRPMLSRINYLFLVVERPPV